MKKYANNIFDILAKLNKHQWKFYKYLSQPQQNGIAPLILMRWLSGTTNTIQILKLNDNVNKVVFDLHKHKQLLIQLLSSCTENKHCRYTWNKNQTSQQNTDIIKVIKQTFQYNEQHAKQVIDMFSDDDILQMAINLGYQSKQLNDIKKQLKNRHTSETTTQM